MIDIYGDALPDQLWHGSSAEPPDELAPASHHKSWWSVMDHEAFLSGADECADADERAELDAERRTAYGNIVYDALLNSEDQTLRSIASEAGLDGLGDRVSILFVTAFPSYAERFYGPVIEIEQNADGLIAVISDDNIHPERASWLMVFEAGSPFPLKQKASPDASPLPRM